jgi:hypothetical protein
MRSLELLERVLAIPSRPRPSNHHRTRKRWHKYDSGVTQLTSMPNQCCKVYHPDLVKPSGRSWYHTSRLSTKKASASPCMQGSNGQMVCIAGIFSAVIIGKYLLRCHQRVIMVAQYHQKPPSECPNIGRR